MNPAIATKDNLQALKHLFNSLPNMVALIDSSLRYRLINAAYIEYFGSTAEQLIGKYAGEVLGPAYASMLDRYFAQTLKGKTTTWVINHTSAEFGEKLLSVKLLPYPANSKTVQHILFVAEDITETMQLHRKLASFKTANERKLVKSPDELERTLRSSEYHALNLDGKTEYVEPLQLAIKRQLFSSRVKDQLSQMQQDGGYKAFLVFTIKNHADIIRQYGRDAGLAVLNHFTDRLDTLLGDAISIGQIGTERVAISIPDISLETAMSFGQLLCREMKQVEIQYGGQRIHYSVYSGATSYPPADARVHSLQ